MIFALMDGFLLGGSLIVAIGAQNAFVIRQGLVGRHIGWICLFCALADAVLIVAGVLGVGLLMAHVPLMVPLMTYAGAAYLTWFGCGALWRAFRPVPVMGEAQAVESLKTALLRCAGFTLLNPHVYLDTVVLVGSLANARPADDRFFFSLGAVSASFLWFFTIGYGALLLKPYFDRPRVWQVIDAVIAAIMLSLCLQLLGF